MTEKNYLKTFDKSPGSVCFPLLFIINYSILTYKLAAFSSFQSPNFAKYMLMDHFLKKIFQFFIFSGLRNFKLG